MEPGPVFDLKAFVPAKDHELAKRFYSDLGFQLNWDDGQMAELQVGGFRFFLQNFYLEAHAANFMLHLTVEDVDAWWQHIEDAKLTERYPGVTAKPPALQPWGLRALHLIDPTGVLWHISERAAAG